MACSHTVPLGIGDPSDSAIAFAAPYGFDEATYEWVTHEELARRKAARPVKQKENS